MGHYCTPLSPIANITSIK